MTKLITFVGKETKADLVVINKRKNYHIELFSRPEVASVTTEKDALILNAHNNPTISELDNNLAITEMSITSKYICKDLGIRMKTAQDLTYASTRFFQMLKTHFKDLTIQEVKLAFELLSVGDLDQYLPNDKNGTPDRNHYNEFNVVFQTKVLSAFRKFRSKTFGKGNKVVHQLKMANVDYISPKERKANRSAILEHIYKSFYNYKVKGQTPNFILSTYINVFIENNLLEKETPDKFDLQRAYREKISSGELSSTEKKIVVDEWSKGAIPSAIQTQAQAIQNNKTIASFFQSLINEGKDIRDVLKSE